MSQIDWPTLMNWIISGIIGAIFGIIGTWIAHRFARKRDDINWQRKLEEQKRQLILEQQQQSKERLREQILKDVNNPGVIRELSKEFRNIKGLFPQTLSELEAIQAVNAVLNLVLRRIEFEISEQASSASSTRSNKKFVN